jgi:hypothetical protein
MSVLIVTFAFFNTSCTLCEGAQPVTLSRNASGSTMRDLDCPGGSKRLLGRMSLHNPTE